MKVSAFTYVRNGIMLDYPFIESIKSVLPLVNEFVVVIGNSTDGTREAVENINNLKIKIVDSIWDENNRTGGLIFAQQSNIGLDNVNKNADWLFHIQADEVIHEEDYTEIQEAMNNYVNDQRVEGFLFNFLNFYGDYNYYAPSRRFHQHEIRIIRNNPKIRSYRDSQGFRKFDNPGFYLNEKGKKLNVVKLSAKVYHYSYVKNPVTQLKKQIAFGNRYRQDDDWISEYLKENKDAFRYDKIDFLTKFQGTHPRFMSDRIKKQDWSFNYKYNPGNMSLKERLLKLIQDTTGKQIFTYKNYKILKRTK